MNRRRTDHGYSPGPHIDRGSDHYYASLSVQSPENGDEERLEEDRGLKEATAIIYAAGFAVVAALATVGFVIYSFIVGG